MNFLVVCCHLVSLICIAVSISNIQSTYRLSFAGRGPNGNVTNKSFVLHSFFGSDRSSRSHDLCLSVTSVTSCLEQSLFIFLGQRAIRALREQSQNTKREISESYRMGYGLSLSLMASTTKIQKIHLHAL